MKFQNILLAALVAIFFVACKPEVKPLKANANAFCPCSNVSFEYQVDGASSANISVDPASALESGFALPTLITNDGQRHSASVRLCSDATVTVSATNSNGTSSQSVRYTAFALSSGSGEMVPNCSDGNFNGWAYNPSGDNLPLNAQISQFTFISDRAGVLSDGSGSNVSIPSAGRHVIPAFVGQAFFGGTYFFNAPLLTNERCAENGTTLPNGTVSPPNQSITFEVICP